RKRALLWLPFSEPDRASHARFAKMPTGHVSEPPDIAARRWRWDMAKWPVCQRATALAHSSISPLQFAAADPTLSVFSGRGGNPHRRYAALPRARERLPRGRASRSGEMPGPTVIVRMKENA